MASVSLMSMYDSSTVQYGGDTLDEVLQLKQGSVTSLYGKLRSSVVPAAAQQALSALASRPAWLQHHGTAASSEGHAAVPAGTFNAAPAPPPAHDAAAAAAAVSLGPACSAPHLMDLPSPEVLSALLATAQLSSSDREQGVQASSACNLPSHGGTQGSTSIIPAMLQLSTPAAAAVLSPGPVDAMFLGESRAHWLQGATQQLPTGPMPGVYTARASALGHDASLSVLDGHLCQLHVGGLNLSAPEAGSLNPPGLEMPCFAESTAGVAAAGMTEMCRSWQDSGSCRYGGRCQFAHGGHELRPLVRHPKYRTQPCRTFSLTGNCPYGDRCTFLHDLAPSLNLISLGGSSCILQDQGVTAALATQASSGSGTACWVCVRPIEIAIQGSMTGQLVVMLTAPMPGGGWLQRWLD
eukprot:gene5992-6230_t